MRNRCSEEEKNWKLPDGWQLFFSLSICSISLVKWHNSLVVPGKVAEPINCWKGRKWFSMVAQIDFLLFFTNVLFFHPTFYMSHKKIWCPPWISEGKFCWKAWDGIITETNFARIFVVFLHLWIIYFEVAFKITHVGTVTETCHIGFIVCLTIYCTFPLALPNCVFPSLPLREL